MAVDGDSFDGDDYLAVQNETETGGYPPLENVSVEVQTLLIAMYSLTSALSFTGNVTVIGVLLLGKRSSKGIRHFLVNLAVSDIVMAIFCIPFTYTNYMFGRWMFPAALCPAVLFMQQVAVTVSVYTLAAIGVDRFVAIMYPLQLRWTKSFWPVLTVLATIWLMAISMSTVILIYGKSMPFDWANATYYDCVEKWPSVEWGQAYPVISFVVTFVLPLTILAFTYSSIAWKMWKHTSPGNADADRDQMQLLAKTKVIKMLSLVVLLFAMCWFPLQVYTLFVMLNQELMSELSPQTNAGIFFTCHWLAMANSFVNPIIYCFMNDNFWSDLRLILRRCCQWFNCQRKQPPPTTKDRNIGSFRSTTYVLSFRTTTGSTQSGGICLRKMAAEKQPVLLPPVANHDEPPFT